jgi:hypothetical protein
MSKILVNNTDFDVEMPDNGVTVLAHSTYTIPPQDYPTFQGSSDVITQLSNGNLILNDGGTDIATLSQAVDVIKGWPLACPVSTEESFFFDLEIEAIGSAPIPIYSQTIDPGIILELSRLVVACRVESIVQVFKNGNVVGSIRTGASLPMSSFDWRPNNKCVEGDSIEVVLTKRSNAPDNTVGVHLMGVKTTL